MATAQKIKTIEQELQSTYTISEMREMLSAGRAPAHCKNCGEFVTRAELDASWDSSTEGTISCNSCDDPTQIASVIRILGYI